MIKSIFIILIFLLPSLVYAGSWDKTDTILEVTWQGLHQIDWAQTRYIAKNPDKLYERNPIMGRHPSIGKVNTYMGISAIVHPIVSYILPKPYKRYWQYISIGVSGGCVLHNTNVGIRMSF